MCGGNQCDLFDMLPDKYIRQSVTNVEMPNQMRDKTDEKNKQIESKKYEYEILTGAKRE